MKNLKFNVLLLLLFSVAFFACGDGENNQSVEINTPAEVKAEKKAAADIADASFVDGMTGKVFHNYLQVKMALVNSDADGVQTAAANMAEAFTTERAELKNLAQEMADSDDLETQRTAFFGFTKAAEKLFKEGLSEGTIYKQFCPMAFDNTGATWFSDVSEIRNPYFGEKMLKCGKVEEVIN